MDEQNVGVETTVDETEQQAPAEEVKTEVQDASTERDYRKELEEEQAKLARVEKDRDNYRTATIIKNRQLRKKAPSDEGDEFEEEFNDQSENQADVIADRVLQKIAPAISQNVVEQEIANYTQDPDKSSFIRFHYDNSIVKSGMDAASIRADIQKAIAIADAPRLRIERDEVARVALASKTPSLSSSGRGSESEVKINPYGWTPEQIKTINERQQSVMGRDMTEQELTRAWNMAKNGSAHSETPPAH